MQKPAWILDPSITPSDYAGFCYVITHIKSGRKYIGRKYLEITKGKKVVGPSKWETYWGSSKELDADLKKYGHAAFKREIVTWHLTRQQTNYHEAKLQFEHDVLTAKLPDGSPAYYNSNILGRYYRATLNAAKPKPKAPTHCSKGHAWDKANTIQQGKKRQCRACIALKSSKNRFQHK